MMLLLAALVAAEPGVRVTGAPGMPPRPGQTSTLLFAGGTPIAEVRAVLASADSDTEVRLVPRPRAWTADEVEALVHDSPEVRKLSRLDVSGNPIGPAGAKAIAASPYLDQLRGLDLTGCKIEEAGARGLAYSEHLGSLTVLAVDGADLNERGLAELRARYGDRMLVR